MRRFPALTIKWRRLRAITGTITDDKVMIISDHKVGSVPGRESRAIYIPLLVQIPESRCTKTLKINAIMYGTPESPSIVQFT